MKFADASIEESDKRIKGKYVFLLREIDSALQIIENEPQ